MPQIALPWGGGELALSLPEHWSLQQEARAALPAAGQDWRDRLAVALNQPATGEPLSRLLAARRNGRIVLVLEDVSRHSPLPEILDVLMREITHAGTALDQIEIVFATGMHPPMTAEQAAEKIGPAAKGIRWRCNPWHDPQAYVSLGRAGKIEVNVDRGVAEADLRILVSSVSPHLQAGFGGGYKMLLPGCAGLDTIRALHRLGIGRTVRQWVGTEAQANPMRAAIDAGGELVDRSHGRSFSVQYVLDESNKPAFLAAGEVEATQRMMAKRCSVACGVVVNQLCDVLITNAHPLDFDLWQSFKCIANTRWAVRAGGAIVCLSLCRAGLNGMKTLPWPLSPTWTRRFVRAMGPDALYSVLTRATSRLAGDAAFFCRLALQTLARNPIFMAAPGLVAETKEFPGIELFGDPQEAIAAADRYLGSQAQRVAVFPHGGTTFPMLAAGLAHARHAEH